MILKDKPSFKGSKMSEIINRAFMYGESVFTTMRMVNGHLCDWNSHFDRLKKSVDFVYGPFSEGDDWVLLLKNRLLERCAGENGDRVIRLTIYREQARGLVRSGIISVNDLKISLSTSHYDSTRTEGKMLKLRTCATPIRPHWWPSFLKAGSYLETILAQKMAMQPGDDDVLFLSPHDTVLESSVANIFVVRHKKLYTAPTGPNVLDGIMRQKVIKESEDFFDDFVESETTVEQLFKADAVFGTNSVRGPFLIDKIDGYEIKYEHNFLTDFEALRKRVMT
jgi:branched-subunit amino acid aminotransferase/4-amino-4-deoxychorismate lyase